MGVSLRRDQGRDFALDVLGGDCGCIGPINEYGREPRTKLAWSSLSGEDIHDCALASVQPNRFEGIGRQTAGLQHPEFYACALGGCSQPMSGEVLCAINKVLKVTQNGGSAMRLPGEEELRHHIQTNLADEFRVASDLLNLGMGIFSPTTRAQPPEPVGHLELLLDLGIVAKACRQYRAVLALAELSLGDVAESNSRMLLETMLAACFLMQAKVTLKQGGKPVPDIPGYPLTPVFRTQLYLAHDATSTLKMLRGMAEIGDISKEDAARVLALAEKHSKESLTEIGPEWAKRQRDTRSYAGVCILDLADSLGKSFVYHTFYRPACSGVHGADARKFVDVTELEHGFEFSAKSTPKGVAEALVLSSMAMVDVLDVANQRLGLGIEERLHGVAQRASLMAKRLPGE